MITVEDGQKAAQIIASHSAKVWGVLLVFFMTAYVHPVAAQSAAQSNPEKLELTLQQVLETARENNKKIQMAGEDVQIARSQFRETNALFLPEVSLEETAISTNNPLNVFGSKLRQEVVTAADFDPALLNDPDGFENFTTSINVRQPLLNPSGFLGRSALKDQVKATRFQQQRTEEFIAFQVKQVWYQLLLEQRRVGIVDTALTAAKANLDQANDFFDQGMINRADLLAAEVRVKQLRNQRSQAENGLENTRRQLAYLVGYEDEVVISPAGSLQRQTVAPMDIDLMQLNQTRSDMLALEHQIEASKKKLTSGKFSFVPSVNLFGSYEWNDDVLFGTGAENYLVGATLKWDLFKGYKNIGSIQRSKAELSKAQLQRQDQVLKNRVEIRSAMQSLETTREQVDIAESALAQARESYRIRSNRFEQGMERVSDLLTAEATLAESRLQLASALFKYNLQVARLEFLLEQDLDR